jgi:phosphohistidine phosphatase
MAGPHLVMLLRHAIAEDAGPSRRDEDRRLTGEGRRKMREVAAAVAALELPVGAILTSPLRRARETAEILAEVLRREDEVEVCDALAPGVDADKVFAALGTHRAASGIVLVGHEPDMGELLSTLLAGTRGLVRTTFKKAGLAGVTVAELPPRSAGVLEFLLTPGQLRRIGRS